MIEIKTPYKKVIENYAPYWDIGYYSKKWCVIKNNLIYNLYFDSGKGELYFVITNTSGSCNKFFVKNIDNLWFYSMCEYGDKIAVIYSTFDEKIYFFTFDLKNKVVSQPSLIYSCEDLEDACLVSNLVYDGNNLYFVLADRTYPVDYADKIYLYLFVYNGTQWYKKEIYDGDPKLKFLYEKVDISLDFRLGFGEIKPCFKVPSTYFDILHFDIKYIDSDGYYYCQKRPFYDFGIDWQPETELGSYARVTEPNTRNYAYEPLENCYNGVIPEPETEYPMGTIFRFYDGDWRNIYYGVRNDIILVTRNTYWTGTLEMWYNDVLPVIRKFTSNYYISYPGIVNWGGVWFHILKFVRSYTIHSVFGDGKTGKSLPYSLTYGEFRWDATERDGNLYFLGGQVRPLRWLPQQAYALGEMIIEEGKMFQVIDTNPGEDNVAQTSDEDNMPDFSQYEHGDTFWDNEIKWRCFDYQNYIYSPHFHFPFSQYNQNDYLPKYEDEYTYGKKIFFVDPQINNDDITDNIIIEFENVESPNDKDEVMIEKTDEGVEYIDIMNTNLALDDYYNIHIKKTENFTSTDTFILPFQFSGYYNQYTRILALDLCSTSDYLFTYLSYDAKKTSPSHPGRPYDIVVINKSNLEIINKGEYLPVDWYENTGDSEQWTSQYRKMINIKDKIYFGESDIDAWEEKIRCFLTDDYELIYQWLKSLPEETTYNDNRWLFTDGNYIYCFFHYDRESFIIKKIDLNGENGVSYLIKPKDFILSWYTRIYIGDLLITGNKLLIPAYFQLKNEYEYNYGLFGGGQNPTFFSFYQRRPYSLGRNEQ